MEKRTPSLPEDPELPPYVLVKHGQWYVRRNYDSGERTASGKIKYIQIVKRCDPENEERAKDLADAIDAEVKKATGPAEETPPTVEEYIDDYLAAKRPTVAARTYDMDLDIFERFVKGTVFSQRIMSAVTTRHLEEYYRELPVLKNASADTIARVNKLLSSAFNYGTRRGDFPVNPTRGAFRPKVNKPDIVVFNEREAKDFLDACRLDDQNIIFEFALETFARPEEYLALQLADIDLDQGLVTIRRKVAYNLKGGGFIFKTPKTRNSKRTIEISAVLCSRLRSHLAIRDKWIAELRNGHRGENKKRLYKRKDKTLANLAEHDLLFPSADGTPISIKNLNVRRFKKTLTAAALDPKKFTVYALRHTGITLSLAAGGNIKAVSEKAGHASVRITLDTYSHVIPSMRKEATEKLAAVLY